MLSLENLSLSRFLLVKAVKVIGSSCGLMLFAGLPAATAQESMVPAAPPRLHVPYTAVVSALTDQVLSRDWWPNPAWNLEGSRTASGRFQSQGKTTGWIVDMAVPADPLLRRLGVKSFRPMTLQANLLRYETMPDAEGKPVFIPMDWAPVLYGCPHISPGAMGFLVLDPPAHP